MKRIITMLAVLISMQANAQLTTLGYAARIGGSSLDEGRGIAVDINGNSYSTGYYQSSFTVAGSTLTHSGNRDCYLIKRDSSGTAVWAKKFGGSGQEYGHGVAVDSAGDVYLTGWFENTVDFDPNSGVSNLTSSGATDAFLVKLSSAGSLVYARKFGGASNDYAFNVALSYTNGLASAYVVGYFEGTADYDPTPTVSNVVSAGSADAFVWRVDAQGDNPFAWRMGGSGFDQARGIGIDHNNNVNVTGAFTGTADFDPSTANLNLTVTGNANSDVFVAQYDSLGAPIWLKQIGGTGVDFVSALTVSRNNIFIGGYYSNTVDFDPGVAVANSTSAATSFTTANGFILKLNQAGDYVWHKTLDCNDQSEVKGLVANSTDGIAATGDFQGQFSIPGVSNISSNGGIDLFITTMNPDGTITGAYSAGSSSFDRGQAIAIDGNDNIYTTGSATGNFDIDATSNFINSISLGGVDGYTVKYSQFICSSNNAPIAVSNCGPYTSPTSNKVWTTSGTYIDTFVNVTSCDSFITYNLTINTAAPIALTFDGTAFTATPGLASYSWTRNATTIVGAISNTYTPAQNGTYEVTATDTNGCAITASFNLMNLSVKDLNITSVAVYPNPVSNQLTVGLDNHNLKIAVRDMSGKIILRSNNNTIEVSALSHGMYFLEAQQNGRRFVTKFVKE